MLEAIRLSIEDTKEIWATGGYTSPETNAKALGNINTLMMMEAWIEGIKLEDEKEQADGKQIGDTPNG